MEKETNEFSFILKPAQYGVGVFAAHDIAAGTYLRLFAEEEPGADISVERKIENVPEFFRTYCTNLKESLKCPRDFGRMEIGWYLNHSKTPNTYNHNQNFYAVRDIQSGEEITIDYNTLDEPEESKEFFYN